jgi:protein subunit release factor A
MERLLLELRAAEGGEDAKLLVEDMLTVYATRATRRGL